MAKEKREEYIDHPPGVCQHMKVSKEIYGFALEDTLYDAYVTMTHLEAVRLVNFFLSDPDFLSSQKLLNQQEEKDAENQEDIYKERG